MKQIRFSLLLVITAILLAGCASTKLEMDKNLSDEPKDALLTGLTVSINFGKSSGLVSTINNAVAVSELEEFGLRTQDSVASFLSNKGFDLYTDEAVATRVDLPSLGSTTLEKLAGFWKHPETSSYTSTYFTGFAIGFDAKEHIAKVKGDDDAEYFVYSEVRVNKVSSFGSFGNYPMATLNIAVVNSEGEVILEAQAFGKGDKQLFGCDLGADNLSLALNNAITSLENL